MTRQETSYLGVKKRLRRPVVLIRASNSFICFFSEWTFVDLTAHDDDDDDGISSSISG